MHDRFDIASRTVLARSRASRGSHAVDFPARRIGELRKARGPGLVLCLAFAAFLVVLPAETIDIGSASLSKTVGYLFLPLAAMQPGFCFRRPPKAFWCFATYILVFLSMGLLGPAAYLAKWRADLFALVQLLVLFWLGYSLFAYDRVVRLALGGFVASCAVVSLLQSLRVTTVEFVSSGLTGPEERLSAFNTALNSLGMILAAGAVTLVGLAYFRKRGKEGMGPLSWATFALILYAVTLTGSRGSLVAVAGGWLVLVLKRGTLDERLRSTALVLVGCVAMVLVSLRSETYVQRWQRTLEQGTMAGREKIYPAAIKMVLEKPIQGWGPVKNYYELGVRLGLPTRDTHNLILWILTEVGLIGGIPYFAGVWLALRGAWRARRGPRGVLPLALLVCLLLANMSVTALQSKVFWLALGLAVASDRTHGSGAARRVVRVQPIPPRLAPVVAS